MHTSMSKGEERKEERKGGKIVGGELGVRRGIGLTGTGERNRGEIAG